MSRRVTYEETKPRMHLSWEEFKVSFLAFVARRRARDAGINLPEVADEKDDVIPEEVLQDIEKTLS